MIDSTQKCRKCGRTGAEHWKDGSCLEAKRAESPALATSEDLREVVFELEDGRHMLAPSMPEKLSALASALDRLHATPGLQEAMERMDRYTKMPAWGELKQDMTIILTALRHLLPATPEGR